jgi:hypothetical protein
MKHLKGQKLKSSSNNSAFLLPLWINLKLFVAPGKQLLYLFYYKSGPYLIGLNIYFLCSTVVGDKCVSLIDFT